MKQYKILKWVIRLVLLIVFIGSLPYYNSCFYSFEKHVPFKGNVFYNPYENNNGKWIKSNFHAHSKLLFGLANGENTMQEMFDKYDSLNYQLPCLSNYNSITKDHNRDFYLNVYEHGFNLGFKHQLILNTKEASLFDFPFVQFTSHQQYIINQLKRDNNLIALAHPKFKLGYNSDDLEVLRNYDLMEIISPRANSINLWDKALSSGKVVWGIGNDDAHDIKKSHCGVAWTMINVASNENDQVVKNLKSGNCYATKGWLAQEMIKIKSVTVFKNNYRLELTQPADSIILKSDKGITVATLCDTNCIEYTIAPENTYVRAEIFETEPWNTYTKVYLNPVIRTIDGTISSDIEEMEISWMKTGLYFTFLILIDFFLLKFILKPFFN